VELLALFPTCLLILCPVDNEADIRPEQAARTQSAPSFIGHAESPRASALISERISSSLAFAETSETGTEATNREKDHWAPLPEHGNC
jgi:hypothetical protein